MRRRLQTKRIATCLMLGVMMLCGGCAKSSMDIIAEQMEASGADTSESGNAAKEIYEELQKGVEETRKKEEKDEDKIGNKEVSFGQLKDGVYTNKYLSVKCDLDDNWVYYSATELQNLKDMVQDAMDESSMAKALKKLDYVMDMRAENGQDQTMISVVYTKLSMEDRKKYAKMTEKEIIDAGLVAVNAGSDIYAQAGMELKEVGTKTVTFLGKKRTAQYMVSDVYGENYYTLQFFDYHTGEYATCFTVASFAEDKTLELLDLFSTCE